MLITGAGSPTGMQVYEGNLLPSIFHGQPIHCDAGPNVVRAYVTQPDGAGYKAEIVKILEGTKNRWFRPSDVAVAPDGSLIVADWYDPGVGGHGMGDVTHGRLFRVTTKAALKYHAPSYKLDTVEGAVEALKSPNEEARYLAYQTFKQLGNGSSASLQKLFEDAKAEPQHRARALWGLASLSASESAGGPAHSKTLPRSPDAPADAKRPGVLQPVGAFERLLATALADTNPNIRITTLRAARQLWQHTHPEKLREIFAKVVKDKDPAVRREVAIALRFDRNPEASRLWMKLALQHAAGDKWTVEALGIGADLFKEERDEASSDVEEIDYAKTSIEARFQILMRTRDVETVRTLADQLTRPNEEAHAVAKADSLKVLRTLQLLQYHHPKEVAAAALTIFHNADPETALAAATLLSREEINKDPTGKARLNELLKPVIGKPEFISLVQRMNLTGFEKELLDYIVANPNAPESVNAARLIAADVGGAQRFLKSTDAVSAKSLIAALGRVSDRPSVAVLNQHFWNEKREDVRRALIDALSLSNEGGRAILKWNSEGKLPAELKDQAALALSRSTDGGVRDQAAKELPLPAAQGLADFPKLPELLKLKGDAAKGQQMYLQAGCVACHRVKDQFVDFGPDLTLIGGKLSAEGLFTAILYPSAAIEHSFIGQQITTKEGQTLLGYAISDTDEELTLRIAGGASQPVKKASITKKEEMKQSLMPPGLAGAIGAQGLADLVAWLQTLK